MTLPLLRVIAYSLIPVAASGIGGVIAAFWPPGQTMKSVIQHFAAGVVFAAAALELIPRIRVQSPLVAILGFAAGIVAMTALRAGTTKLKQSANRQSNLGLIGATGVDVFIDGLVMGAGFATGERTGILLAIALVLEFIFLGLSVAVNLGSQVSRRKIIATPAGLALLTVMGAVIGVTILGSVSTAVLAGVLAFGAVALMYLVTEELLVEAHQTAEGTWIATAFFVGFLIYLIIDELFAH